jgi:hypothetical protein
MPMGLRLLPRSSADTSCESRGNYQRSNRGREVQALGVIKPLRTDGGRGRRSFSARDVRAAQQWIAKQRAAR